MSINHFFKSLLLLSIVFSSQVNAATNFQTFPDLQVGSVSSYVKELQKVLNGNGFPIAKAGQPGSINNETVKFGILTQKALKDFQTKYKITPATGNFATKTKIKFNDLISIKVNPGGLAGKGKPVSGVYLVDTTTGGCVNGRASSLTYYGVTLTFATTTANPQFPQCGSFANGEPWLVGPISIIHIDNPGVPVNSKNVGGAMINPVPHQKQGYSRSLPFSHSNGYNPALDVSIGVSTSTPLYVNAADSLIVSRGTHICNDATPPVCDNANSVEVVVGFIVLGSVPPEGSFRPGLYGTDHTIKFNKSDINWSVLKNLNPVPATPSQAWIENPARLPALPFWEWSGGWDSSSVRPFANSGAGDGWAYRSNYGRDIAFKWGHIALWLNTSNTQAVKEKAMIQTIQAGLDMSSYFDTGDVFSASGGHQVGFKFPLLLAAAALNDSHLKAYASAQNMFVEDIATWFVQQNDVERPVMVYNKIPNEMYHQSDVGMAEWGITHSWDPTADDNRWNVNGAYRHVQWPAVTGSVLAAEIMGLRDLWNHPAIFAYTERHTAMGGLGPVGPNDSPVSDEGQMWQAYKPALVAARVAPVRFSPTGASHATTAQTVSLTTTTSGAQIHYTIDGSTPNQSSPVYTSPLAVSADSTIKAIASKPGLITSDELQASYVFDLQLLDKSKFTVVSVDSQEIDGFQATYAFDGASSTMWHTRWRSNLSDHPHEIVINLGDTYNVNGFSYLPRQDGQQYGNIKQYEFYVSADGLLWGNPASAGTLVSTDKIVEVKFSSKTGRYIKLKALSDYGNSQNTNVAELGIAASDAPVNYIPPSTDSDSDGISDTQDKCPATPSAYRTNVNTYGCPKPLLSTLKLINNMTTTDFTNIAALELEDINSVFGKIRYTQPVNIFGTTDKTTPINFDSYINIQNRKVIVNGNTAPQFNKQATVTLYNINMTKPTVTKDGVVYASSTSPNMSYDPVAKTLTFTADGF